MNESDWLQGSDPRPMLDFIRHRTTPRKLRLFACACVREVWPLLFDDRSVRAVEVAERFAEGRATAAELVEAETAAFELARAADLRVTVTDPGWAAARAAARTATLDAYSAAGGTAFVSLLCHAPWVFRPAGGVLHHGTEPAKSLARHRHCDLLREIVGNPFQSPMVEGDWLRWNGEVVVCLAGEIHDSGRYAELPVIADALEEAGCTCPTLLDHLRRPGGHVRGCWALDFLLGK